MDTTPHLGTRRHEQVLRQDGQVNESLAQMTTAVLRQNLAAEAALAGYHDLFFMFATLALVSLVPVLFLRRRRSTAASTDSAEGRSGPPPRSSTRVRSPH